MSSNEKSVPEHSFSQPFSRLVEQAFGQLEAGFASLPHWQATSVDEKRCAEVLGEIAQRMQGEYPYFHPLYAGQMLRPPHPVARAAYALAMAINPNNHALDGGRASSAMEVEAVAALAHMFGWKQHLGHLTSGGTFANLEALWVGGRLRPGRRVLASSQSHYTHQRISAVLHLPFAAVRVDERSRMDLNALEDELRRGDVGTVVATLGTTATGAVDPLDGIVELKKKYDFRLHVDAAYGGYFKLIADELEAPARKAYATIAEADSIVVDPHKHGLQPYGCGSVLFRDPAVGTLYKHDSPYTYFTSHELHLGEISLECSRAGASAVALWATQQVLPMTPNGEFAQGLRQAHAAAAELARRIAEEERFLLPFRPELDIVVWNRKSTTAEDSGRICSAIFEAAAKQDLHLALAKLPASFFAGAWPSAAADALVTSLRSVLMKPEHAVWIDEIWKRLSLALDQADGE